MLGSDFDFDCDDDDRSVYPGAVELCGDGVDQNCNGIDLEDNCGDIYVGCFPGQLTDLSYGLALAGEDATVNICPGVYEDELEVRTSGLTIRKDGRSNEEVLLRSPSGGQTVIRLYNVERVSLVGLSFSGYRHHWTEDSPYIGSPVSIVDSTEVTISDCTFEDMQTDHGVGGLSIEYSEVSVSESSFADISLSRSDSVVRLISSRVDFIDTDITGVNCDFTLSAESVIHSIESTLSIHGGNLSHNGTSTCFMNVIRADRGSVAVRDAVMTSNTTSDILYIVDSGTSELIDYAGGELYCNTTDLCFTL